MTKQEILEYFKDINHAYNESTRLDDLSYMLDELMQSNSDEDCISRKQAIRIAEQGQLLGYEWQFKELCKLPSVQPKPKTGHWVYKLEDWNKWTCSECGWSKRTDVHVKLGYSYCPNCGVKMFEPQESEE